MITLSAVNVSRLLSAFFLRALKVRILLYIPCGLESVFRLAPRCMHMNEQLSVHSFCTSLSLMKSGYPLNGQ
jgi:hypothetical protein